MRWTKEQHIAEAARGLARADGWEPEKTVVSVSGPAATINGHSVILDVTPCPVWHLYRMQAAMVIARLIEQGHLDVKES